MTGPCTQRPGQGRACSLLPRPGSLPKGPWGKHVGQCSVCLGLTSTLTQAPPPTVPASQSCLGPSVRSSMPLASMQGVPGRPGPGGSAELRPGCRALCPPHPHGTAPMSGRDLGVQILGASHPELQALLLQPHRQRAVSQHTRGHGRPSLGPSEAWCFQDWSSCTLGPRGWPHRPQLGRRLRHRVASFPGQAGPQGGAPGLTDWHSPPGAPCTSPPHHQPSCSPGTWGGLGQPLRLPALL